MKYLLSTVWLGAVSVSAMAHGILVADEITLTDGRVIDGEVLSKPNDEQVEIRTRAGGMVAVLHVKAGEISGIRYGKTEQQKRQESFDVKRAALTKTDGTAEQWWALAEEAKALGENPAFRQLAQTTVAHDSDFAPARAALGQVKQDGKWMKPAEAAAARGEVFFRGKWVQAAEREGILTEEARVAQEAETKVAKDRAAHLADLEVATKEAALRTAQAEARRAAEPVSAPAPQIIYSTYTPYPTIIRNPYVWGGCPTPYISGFQQGQYSSGCAGGTGGLSVTATGQGNGYSWGLNYR